MPCRLQLAWYSILPWGLEGVYLTMQTKPGICAGTPSDLTKTRVLSAGCWEADVEGALRGGEETAVCVSQHESQISTQNANQQPTESCCPSSKAKQQQQHSSLTATLIYETMK